MVGDGQVSFGPTILKPNAKKVRVLMDGKVLTLLWVSVRRFLSPEPLDPGRGWVCWSHRGLLYPDGKV